MTDNLEQEGNNIFAMAELANALRMIQENKELYLKQISLYAEMRKHKYDKLVELGFNEIQALQIVINTDMFS